MIQISRLARRKLTKELLRMAGAPAVAEGINNVIKNLKRRSYGFRNMEYFRLKIMQVCGYLNSQFIKYPKLLGT